MPDAPSEGRLLAGRYRLMTELGRGGMGKVWRGHDELLEREVAIKEVPSAGPGIREARMAARLNHPNIATVHDIVLDGARRWIVLELVPARNLAQVIQEQGPLPVTAVIKIGLDVLAGLSAAHQAGILHRDIKPGNVLLTDDGTAILTDFGLATFAHAEESEHGMVVGTAGYLAPERARGGPSTARADVWSLGATLFTAVEGCSPFDRGSQLATLAAVQTAQPPPYGRAGALAPVLDALLAKDPAARPTVDDAVDLLQRTAGLNHRDPDETTPGERRRPRPGRGRLLVTHWREAVVVAALIVAAVAAMGSDRGAVTARPPATEQSVPTVTFQARLDSARHLHVVPAVQRQTTSTPVTGVRGKKHHKKHKGHGHHH